MVPHWFIALLAALLPAWRFGGFKRRRRRSRLAHNLCVNCGYDLRASPDKCPECGEVREKGKLDEDGSKMAKAPVER